MITEQQQGQAATIGYPIGHNMTRPLKEINNPAFIVTYLVKKRDN